MAEADPVPTSFLSTIEAATAADMKEKAHRLRSDYLDACAKLESELYALAIHLAVKCEMSAPIGQRIAAFRGATIADQKRKVRLNGLMDELAHVSSCRAHIVHSSIHLVFDLSDKAILIQFRTVPHEKQLSYTIPLDEMTLLVRKVLQLANRLKQFRTPPTPAAPVGTSATA